MSRQYSMTSQLLKGSTSKLAKTKLEKCKYDVVIIGAGHNGLTSAAYLAKAGLKVGVFEKRHLLGGAAVTEEIVPGYRFSRASYVLSLLRPVIINDLQLRKHGLEWFVRNPASFTPLRDSDKYLLLGSDSAINRNEIAKFSKKDARVFDDYEDFLLRMVKAIDPLLDSEPFNLKQLFGNASVREKARQIGNTRSLWKFIWRVGKEVPEFLQLMTGPITKVLDNWFESEPLKATLATDGVIGGLLGPDTPGSGYVLLHHMMGNVTGTTGQWVTVKGGMGAVSDSIARSALSHGAHLYVEMPVERVLLDSDGSARGIKLASGEEVAASAVLCNATPDVAMSLVKSGKLDDYKRIDYSAGAMKINVAVDKIPVFKCLPQRHNVPLGHHSGTTHLGCETVPELQRAFLEAERGVPSSAPMIEMNIPSSLDPTLAPTGHHVCLLFIQYAPFTLADGRSWHDIKEAYADKVFDAVEEYCPGFKASVVGRDVLSPLDLQEIFGVTGGNIFHGAMSLDQLYWTRPSSKCPAPVTPIQRFYLCGSGAHPGGGVMGSPGRLAASRLLRDMGKRRWFF